MPTASLCFIKGGCASRARIKSSSASAESTIGFTSCNTRSRNFIFRSKPTARRNPRCYRPATDSCAIQTCHPYRSFSPPRPQAAPQGRAKRLLHLSPILGLAPVAREFGPPPLRPSPVYLSFRGKVLRRCRCSREIHRPPPRRKRKGHPHAGIILQEIWS